MHTVIVNQKNGETHTFANSEWRIVEDVVVVSQYRQDDTYGGLDNVRNYAFDCEDIDSVRYE